MNYPITPVIRLIEEASVDVVRVEIGVVAVESQIRIENIFNNEKPSEKDTKYEGVIEVNHDEEQTDQTDIDSEPTESQELIGRQVHNHYIEEPKQTLKELENLYPNESPLLAPN